MTLLLRTIQSFPSGRTSEQLVKLMDKDCNTLERQSVYSDLRELSGKGLIKRTRGGYWFSSITFKNVPDNNRNPQVFGKDVLPNELLLANEADFLIKKSDCKKYDEENLIDTKITTSKLIQYFKLAIKSDPRGSLSVAPEAHGIKWQILSGTFNPFDVIEIDESHCIKLPLDNLPPSFKKSLSSRDDGENSLVLGWPISSGLDRSAPMIRPIGLFSGRYLKTEDYLFIQYDVNNIIVNPSCLNKNIGDINWHTRQLEKVFSAGGRRPLEFQEFWSKLKEVFAEHRNPHLSGRQLTQSIDLRESKIHDSFGIFLTDDTSFNSSAIKDFTKLQELSSDNLNSSALGHFFGKMGKPSAQKPAINLGLVNAEQIEAITSSCQSGISIITGPPGTGKSQAVLSIVASELLNGGSILFASKNHQALDAIQKRLLELSPSTDFLVRTLCQSSKVKNSFESVLHNLLPLQTNLSPEENLELKSRLASLSKLRQNSLYNIKNKDQIECEIADLLSRIDLREKETLIDNAIKIKANKVKKIPTKSWIKQLIRKLFNRGIPVKSLCQASKENGASTVLLTERLEEARGEKAKMQQLENPIKLTEEIIDLAWQVLPGFLANRCHVANEELHQAVEKNDLKKLSTDQKILSYDVAKLILKAKPVWLTSLQGVGEIIPLHQGLFDLVVFDEATECDIATAIPLMYRAKRVVIIGDAHQSFYVPQLSRAQDRDLMQVLELPVKQMSRYSQSQTSLFDSGTRVHSVAKSFFKNQHRSAPQIVNYVSENFYNGKLKPVSDLKNLKAPKNFKPGITWTDVKPFVALETDNINRSEALAIVRHLKVLLVEEKYEGEVGFVSPFQAQVKEFKKLVEKEIHRDFLAKAKLKAGTINSLQCGERDLILFSPTVTSASPTSAVEFVQRDFLRLSVPISKAKAVVHIFGDLDFAKSNKIRPLARLANFATRPLKRKIGENVFDSEWERRVFHALRDKGLDPIPQYEVAGRRLDFALFGRGDVKVDLEVDGRKWHTDINGNRKIGDLWRDHQLRSMGWRVLRFWVDELDKDMEQCIERIEQELS